MFIVSTAGQWLVTVGNSPARYNIWDGPIDETFLGWGDLDGDPDGVFDNLWTVADLAAPPLPGDADGDGDVDAADANVVAVNYGQTVGLGGAADGDHDGNGVVNMLDWDIMAINYGQTVGPEGVSSLPEPASLVLVGVGAYAVLRRRGSRP
jgi:hypothetical protein